MKLFTLPLLMDTISHLATQARKEGLGMVLFSLPQPHPLLIRVPLDYLPSLPCFSTLPDLSQAAFLARSAPAPA